MKKFKSVDGKNNPANPSHAIFPILKQIDKNYWELIGTGFYIATNGIFVTAKHVLEDVINSKNEQEKAIAIFHFFDNNQYIIRPIIKFFCKQNCDIAVGIADEIKSKNDSSIFKNKILILTDLPQNNGDVLHTYAYPKTICEKSKILFQPDYYEGEIIQYYDSAGLIRNKCYQTTILLHGGSSGGPVFNSKGHVIGINSSSFDFTDEERTQPCSFVSDISELLNIEIENIKIQESSERKYTVFELCELGFIIMDKNF